MTKRKTVKSEEKEPGRQYVILQRVSYKAMIPAEREIIEPAEDPFAPESRRITCEHLGKADINRLIMRNIIAPDK